MLGQTNEMRDESLQRASKRRPTGNVVSFQKLTIGELLGRYIGQLLQGCGHPQCTETLCRPSSGRKSSKLLRNLTPRSARATAISICLGPDPQSHICQYYQPSDAFSEPEDGPRDISSFIQQVCDTQSVRRVGLTAGGLPPTRAVHSEDLARMNTCLKDLLKGHTITNAGHTQQMYLSSIIATKLYECLSWLVDRVATDNLRLWHHVIKNGVNQGRAYPSKPPKFDSNHDQDRWLTMSDVLNDQQYLRLLSDIVRVIASRQRDEHMAVSYGPIAVNHSKSSLCDGLVWKIASDGKADPGRVLALVFWFKRLFLHHWRKEVTLEHDQIAGVSLDLIGCLHDSGVLDTSANEVLGLFQFPFLLQGLDMTEAVAALLEDSKNPDTWRQNLLSWSYLYELRDKITFFRTANYLQMRQAYAIADRAELTRKRGSPQLFGDLTEQVQHAEEHYFLLKVSRSDTLKDTFDQLWQRRAGGLLRPLRIRLGETDALEVGHDLGGVQIEFFNLICRQIFATDAQLFTTDTSNGLSFFQPASLQPLYMFEMCGLLFALAVYNGIPLPVDVKQALYWMLCRPTSASDLRPCPLEIFREGWPTINRSLQGILDSDVDGLDYSFPLEANGLRLNVLMPENASDTAMKPRTLEVIDATSIVHHGVEDAANIASSVAKDNPAGTVDLEKLADAWPGWHIIPATRSPETITSANRKTYVKDYISWVTSVSVGPQWSAFANGFFSHGIINEVVLRTCFSPADLRSYVEGTKHLDITQLRNVAVCHAYDPNSRYINWFWQIVTSWPQEKQKQLLKFVTASERLPISGLESMTFVIKKTVPDTMESLPTSSTCFGTLYLPRYATQEILAEKLSLAVEYGMEGFGTA